MMLLSICGMQKVSKHTLSKVSSQPMSKKDLEMHPRSALTRSQRTGQMSLDSLDMMTKWEWKLRNYSVNLKFSTARRGTMWWVKKER